MGFSEYIKSCGIKNIHEFSDKVGVPVCTLRNWYKVKFSVIRYLAMGITTEDIIMRF